jgi:hypothetical protein
MWAIGVVCWLGLVLSSSIERAEAQQLLATGDRVRVTAPSYHLDSRIGTARSVSNDRIEFRPADSTKSIEVLFAGMTALDRSVGSKPSLVQGMLYGLGAGLIGGGVLGAVVCNEVGPGSNCSGNKVATGAAVGLAAGAILGVTILRTDRWVRVTLPSPGKSLGLAATMRF